MNRAMGATPVRTVFIVVVGIAALAVAGLAAQVVLTAESEFGLEVEPVLLDKPAPAVELAPRDALGLEIDFRQADNYRIVDEGVAPASDASSFEVDFRQADNYRIATEVNAGSATAIDPSSPDFDVRLADNYRIFTHAVAVSAAGLEFDVREADNYRIFTQE